jgi:hypothetical protein
MPESNYFSNYLDWKLKNGLELPVYIIGKGKKNFMIDLKEVRIKEDEEQLYVIREGFYSINKGVHLNIPEEFL